jgi:hypothetical protein
MPPLRRATIHSASKGNTVASVAASRTKKREKSELFCTAEEYVENKSILLLKGTVAPV